MDEHLQSLRRRAAFGDEEARSLLEHWTQKIIAPPTSFFLYHQVNVAGIRINHPQEGIGQYVAVEAYDFDHADNIMRQLLGPNFYDYDSCCGHRWQQESPTVHNIVPTRPEYTTYGYYVHYLDGRIVRIA